MWVRIGFIVVLIRHSRFLKLSEREKRAPVARTHVRISQFARCEQSNWVECMGVVKV